MAALLDLNGKKGLIVGIANEHSATYGCADVLSLLDGPLAFDNAVSRESAAIKGIHSPVAEDADILVVPDLESGNMLYKERRCFSGVQGAGAVLGAQGSISALATLYAQVESA